MKNNSFNQPRLKKKNGVWIKVLVPVLCIVAGAGAMAGLIAGVPAVSNAVIKQDTNSTNPGSSTTQTDQSKLTELQNKLNTATNELATRNKQIADKDLQVSNLNEQVASLELQLQAFSDYDAIKSELELKSAELEQAIADGVADAETITALQQEVETLTQQIQTLETECERYKELLGSNLNYAEIVVQLQGDLDSANSQLSTVTAERDLLIEEKAALTQQVTDLTAELEQVKEQLGNYIATENVDHLQITSYNGTWYLNGTYEDYFEIKDGQVSRGNQAIKGVIQEQNKEMKMWLNDGTFKTITLADGGASIIVDGSQKYTNFIVNTIINVEPQIGLISSEYINGNNSVCLNLDNTIKVVKDGVIRYGAYSVISTERNIAGNIEVSNQITATLNNLDGTQEEVIYNVITHSGVLTDAVGDSYKAVYKTQGYEFKSPDNLEGANATHFQNCHKVTFKLLKPLEFKSGTTSYFKLFLNGEATSNFSSIYVNGSKANVNGTYVYSNSVGTYKGTSGYEEYITLYFYGITTSYNYTFNRDDAIFVISTNNSVPKFKGVNSSEMIPVYYEKIGNVTADLTMRSVIYEQQPFVKNCSVIPGLVAGNYSSEDLDFTINEDGSTELDMEFSYGASMKNCRFAEDDGVPTATNTYCLMSKQLGLNNGFGYAVEAYFKVPENLEAGVEYTFAPNWTTSSGNGMLGSYKFTLEDLNGAAYVCAPLSSQLDLTLGNHKFLEIYCKVFKNGVYAFDLDASSTYLNCPAGIVQTPIISSVICLAETDGVNICHNVTLTIEKIVTADDGTESSETSTLTYKLKNNKEIISATLNSLEIILTKN